MGRRRITACTLLALGAAFGAFSPGLFPQEQESAASAPDALRRPERGEAPRYPRDMVIGELGRGEAPEAAYRFAGELLDALIAGSGAAPALADSRAILTDTLIERIAGIAPRICHLGGGRIEADGSVSFMIRFLGAEESVTGELYLRREGGGENGAAGESALSGEDPESGDEGSPEISGPPEARSSEGELSPEGGPPEGRPPESRPSDGRPSEGRWLLDDLVLEEGRPLNEIRDSYRYDFSPYERFF